MKDRELEITPDFIIVGAQKCGTTSLYHWLSSHSECYMTRVKEPHYFANFIPHGLVATNSTIIRDSHQYSELYYNAKPNQVKGEASPSYFLDSHAAARIANANHNCRIIICVRDPVERAYSQYRMNVIAGIEIRSFEKTIQDCLDKPGGRDWAEQNYVELSSYGMQLQNYVDAFSLSQIFVCTLDEIQTDPIGVMTKISNFLDIDRSYWETYNFVPKHQGRDPRGRLARRLLGSPTARAFGRILVPKELRPIIAHHFMGKRTNKHVDDIIDDRTTKLIWGRVESEIQEFERLIGRGMPELWKTHPNARSSGELLENDRNRLQLCRSRYDTDNKRID